MEGLDDAKKAQQQFPHLTVLADESRGLSEAAGIAHPQCAAGRRGCRRRTAILVDRQGMVLTVSFARGDRALSPDDVLQAIDRYVSYNWAPRNDRTVRPTLHRLQGVWYHDAHRAIGSINPAAKTYWLLVPAQRQHDGDNRDDRTGSFMFLVVLSAQAPVPPPELKAYVSAQGGFWACNPRHRGSRRSLRRRPVRASFSWHRSYPTECTIRSSGSPRPRIRRVT